MAAGIVTAAILREVATSHPPGPRSCVRTFGQGVVKSGNFQLKHFVVCRRLEIHARFLASGVFVQGGRDDAPRTLHAPQETNLRLSGGIGRGQVRRMAAVRCDATTPITRTPWSGGP